VRSFSLTLLFRAEYVLSIRDWGGRVGVAEKQFVVHLWTLRQNVSRWFVVPKPGVNRSEP